MLHHVTAIRLGCLVRPNHQPLPRCNVLCPTGKYISNRLSCLAKCGFSAAYPTTNQICPAFCSEDVTIGFATVGVVYVAEAETSFAFGDFPVIRLMVTLGIFIIIPKLVWETREFSGTIKKLDFRYGIIKAIRVLGVMVYEFSYLHRRCLIAASRYPALFLKWSTRQYHKEAIRLSAAIFKKTGLMDLFQIFVTEK